jgi:RNA polymerase sigma-70 factor
MTDSAPLPAAPSSSWEQRATEVGRTAWPGIAIPEDRFAAYVRERLSDEAAVADALDRLNIPDLYLACACAAGDPLAIASFEAAFLVDCEAVLASFARTSGLIDEVKQRVRTKLLVAGSTRPGIEAYAGRGTLRSWLRVVLTREAVTLTRRTSLDVPFDACSHEGATLAKLDPELQFLRASCAAEFELAFRDAAASLSAEDRNLLRCHYLDGLGIDPLGALLGVHRVTASRRLNKARATLVTETRRLLAERLRLDAPALESLLRLIESEVDVSCLGLRLRSAMQRSPDPGITCLDANTVARFFDGDLSTVERGAVHAHIDVCDECRELTAALSRAVVEETHPDDEGVAGPTTIGQRIGRYVVFEWLGQGGMGVVYGAYDPKLERAVALKLVRTADHERASSHASSTALVSSRLVLEAQALARVSHPNVISVFDVGTHDGEVFMAMEYVRGTTLERWLRMAPRSYGEILARFEDAARGLLAAHAAGLVHGDFKPSNVLMGDDGRVRVTDFGLARALGQDPASAPLTRSFGRAGTPAYMSPEQSAGGTIDARSDQYSFCVALGEALVGVSAIPARVREAIERGRATRPEDRYPSMEELLAAVSRRGPFTWARVSTALVVVLSATVVVGLAMRARVPPARPCRGAERKLAGIWDAEQKRRIASSFEQTGAHFGAEAQREVGRVLDAYAARWVSAHTEACEATRVHGEQSESLLDLRVSCLDGIAGDLKAFTELLAHADRSVVENATKAAYALPGPETCANVRALGAARPMPSDATTQGEIRRIREAVEEANALSLAGQFGRAEERVRSLVEPAKQTGYATVESEVEFALGRARVARGDLEGGIGLLYEAVLAAEAANDDEAKARALVQLVYGLGKEAKYDEGERAGRLAAAVLLRLPTESELSRKLEDNLSFIDDDRGHYADALEKGKRVLDQRVAAFGSDDYRVAMSWNNVSKHTYMLGHVEEAVESEKRALAIWERVHGPLHPSVALGLFNLAVYELQLRRLKDALVHVSRAHDIFLDAFGEESIDTGRAEGVLASILSELGRLTEALGHAEHALAALERRLPSDNLIKVSALATVGELYTRLGRWEEGLTVLERGRAMSERLGAPPLETAATLTELGRAYLAGKQPAKARAALERSLALRAAQPADEVDRADTDLLRAMALWDLGARAEARKLAVQARDAYERHDGYMARRDEASAWLGTHTAPEPTAGPPAP